MKSIVFLLAFSFVGLQAFNFCSEKKSDATSFAKMQDSSFAVLELFTSQGCSSCPAADKLLAATFKNAQISHQRVFVLSYHVDYWDRLGWKDAFSQPQFTQRQYAYGEYFKNSGVYTPQLVVNGTAEFVGSDARKLNAALENLEKPTANVGISIENASWQNNQVRFMYQLSGAFKNSQLQIAILSKTEETNIPRGENSGLKLIGTNVVRVFQTLKSSEKSIISMSLPKDLTKDNTRIVIFAQDITDNQVLGVKAFDF